MMKALVAIFVLSCAFGAAPNTRGASAVAIAINPKGGLGYGFYHDPEISEAEAQRRAIKECLNWGGRNPHIIASTSKRGYGAVIWFLRADKKLDYCVALGAPTWDVAVSAAKTKAKASGGTAFRIVRGWNDGLGPKKPIIMQRL